MPLYSRKGPAGWADVSAQQFLDQVRALAKGLIAGGITPGETVAVMSGTRYEWTVVDFAIWFAGGVPVPIYETSSASQIEWILHDSGARRIFAEDEAKAGLVREVLDSSGLLGDTVLPVVRMDYDGAAPNLASLAAAGTGVGDAELERHRSAAGLADVASLVYTSGTTGRPKGCEITHGNFALVAKNIVLFLPEILRQPRTRTLMFLPLAHVLARAVQVICLSAGTTVGHTASAKELLEDLASFKPTFLLVVPRIFEKVYAGAAHKAALAGKERLFEAAAAVAIDYSKALDAAARGTGHRPRAGDPRQARPLRPAAVPQAAAGLRRPAGLHGLRGQPAEPPRRAFLPRRGHPRPRRLRPHRNHGTVHGQHARRGPRWGRSASRCPEPPSGSPRTARSWSRASASSRGTTTTPRPMRRRSWTGSSAPATSGPLTRTAS